jgi:hypothetical protein
MTVVGCDAALVAVHVTAGPHLTHVVPAQAGT